VKRLRVVAAVVRRGDAILITRRPDRADRPGQWEFPGGKVEPGETEPAALQREIREELGCAIEVGALLLRHAHRYPDLEVELAFYAARLPEGAAPAPLGVAAIEWARADTLERYDFLEADRAVLSELEARTAAAGGAGEGEGMA
jgi:8-oxo-dGTP diphosphatase